MNRQEQQTSPTRTVSQGSLSDARLPGRWVVLARSTWIILVVLTLGIFFASLPEFLAVLQTSCAGATCSYLQLHSEQVEWLAGMGRSSADYAASLVALALTSVALCLLVSALIVWRRPDDRMALLIALLLVAFGPNFVAESLLPQPSFWQLPLEGLDFLAVALLVPVFSLFPSGRFVPRWTRWTLVVVLAGLVLHMFFPTVSLPNLLAWYLVLGEGAILVVARLYRYRRMSGPLERQQTKWVVLGATVPAVIWIGGTILSLLFPTLVNPMSPAGVFYLLALNSFGTGLVLLIPLSIGVAILRYRLWDIDTLINKALVYGLLTGLLGAVYAGLIIGLQALVSRLTGQTGASPLIIVASTLTIAALVRPVRPRLPALIHR